MYDAVQINKNYCHLKCGRVSQQIAVPGQLLVYAHAEEMNGNGNHLMCNELLMQRII